MRTIDREVPTELRIHLILDNYATHKHPTVRAWLAKHPRFQLHFTPTSSSWLNLVERWFRELTDKALRRGVFHSVPDDLIASIQKIPRRAQRRPPPLRLDRDSRINPRQSRTRPHRPRKSQLIPRHTTSCI
jgi:transposase